MTPLDRQTRAQLIDRIKLLEGDVKDLEIKCALYETDHRSLQARHEMNVDTLNRERKRLTEAIEQRGVLEHELVMALRRVGERESALHEVREQLVTERRKAEDRAARNVGLL